MSELIPEAPSDGATAAAASALPAGSPDAPVIDPLRAPAPRAGKGVIHDLGYARYAGERRSPSTLWRVIMRQQISHTWKTWWRWKPWLICAVITTVVCGVVMYVSRTATFDNFTREGGPLAFVDGVLSYSYRFLVKLAFLVSMTVGAAGVARDRETGAFAFYFSRPVRARDYVIGKLAGMTIVMASITLAGPLLLAVFRIAIARDTDEMIQLLPWLSRTVLVGGLAALVYAAVPLAVSAMIGKRTIAIVVWASYYVVGMFIFAVIGILAWNPLAAVDPANAVVSLANGLWKIHIPGDEGKIFVETHVAIISLVAQTLLASTLFYLSVRKQATGAVGASS